MDEGRSAAPGASSEGSEAFAAERGSESPARDERRMERVCERALARVQANKGAPGVDGMSVELLPEFL